MSLHFDLKSIATVQFGVGRDEIGGQRFVEMPVDGRVQDALREMVEATWTSMREHSATPERYDPSEKHAAVEYLHLPVTDRWAEAMRALHTAHNLDMDSQALTDPTDVFCYFSRMTDRAGSRLTALRRATQFKGSLKSRFIRLATDALKLVQDRLFRLDSDFDLLIDSANLHILRPASFEFAARLQPAILSAVPENVALIQKDLPFVDFTGIEEYANKHPRAARYLASIQSQGEGRKVDLVRLKRQCRNTGVEFVHANGKISVSDENVLGFLEVLDRRRYDVELVKGEPERFKAASRQKIVA
jgi:hypothetical protein